MQTWKNVDKADWPKRGPWDDEPDKAHWIAHDLDCLIVRGPSGGLCGYVGVPKGHPAYEQDYSNVDVRVHGGLTLADACQPTRDEARGICHPKQGAANETVWWLGFDCAHAGDLTPAYNFVFEGDRYRDFEYVKRETESLAQQLAAYE